MLNKNRKGVSEVVANVLIVLLVIVGIAVIWSVVKPTIDKSSNAVRSDCFTVQVEPTACALSAAVAATSGTCSATTAQNCVGAGQSTCPSGETCSGANAIPPGGTATVSIKRNPGAGNFENVEVVFEAGTESERISSGFTSVAGANQLNELQTRTTSALDPSFVPDTANVVLKANGQLCQVTASPIECN